MVSCLLGLWIDGSWVTCTMIFASGAARLHDFYGFIRILPFENHISVVDTPLSLSDALSLTLHVSPRPSSEL
jgi:hypothetical protein